MDSKPQLSPDTFEPLRLLGQEIATLTGVSALLSWDQEVMMPPGAINARSSQSAAISKLIHEKRTSIAYKVALAECIDLESGETNPKLTALQEIAVKESYKDWQKANKLPAKFVEDFAFLLSQSQHIWAEARKANAFDIFAPYLEKVVAKSKEKARLLGFEKAPYNGLIDEHEPGTTADYITPIFERLRKATVPILEQVLAKPRRTPNFDGQVFAIDAQWDFSNRILESMGYDFNRGRLDKSVHPFTTNFHPTDVRITTRINPLDFREAFSSSIHEGGHALYEQGLNPDWFGTPLGEATSLGIHESQSRLWENYVMGSRAFWDGHYGQVQDLFPFLKEVPLDSFYAYLTEVKPSFIRVEADELTYNLHVLIRYEIEQALFNEGANVRELPKLWNSKYQEYLGITPSTDSEGVLQDVHWSCGLFGYFPTYTLGNLYGRQFYDAAKKAIPSLEAQIQKGEFGPLKTWLNREVHRHGRGKSAGELVADICGGPLDEGAFVAYLREKYISK